MLHITTDTKAMLAEALRVIKPGAIAAFSVFGRQENANVFTSVDFTYENRRLLLNAFLFDASAGGVHRAFAGTSRAAKEWRAKGRSARVTDKDKFWGDRKEGEEGQES